MASTKPQFSFIKLRKKKWSLIRKSESESESESQKVESSFPRVSLSLTRKSQMLTLMVSVQRDS